MSMLNLHANTCANLYAIMIEIQTHCLLGSSVFCQYCSIAYYHCKTTVTMPTLCWTGRDMLLGDWLISS